MLRAVSQSAAPGRRSRARRPRRAGPRAWVTGLALLAVQSACAVPPHDAGSRGPDEGAVVSGPPERFTIVPDDYHVPYAGTAEDGRRFFLSQELFSFGTVHHPGSAYVGLFL